MKPETLTRVRALVEATLVLAVEGGFPVEAREAEEVIALLDAEAVGTSGNGETECG